MRAWVLEAGPGALGSRKTGRAADTEHRQRRPRNTDRAFWFSKTSAKKTHCTAGSSKRYARKSESAFWFSKRCARKTHCTAGSSKRYARKSESAFWFSRCAGRPTAQVGLRRCAHQNRKRLLVFQEVRPEDPLHRWVFQEVRPQEQERLLVFQEVRPETHCLEWVFQEVRQ